MLILFWLHQVCFAESTVSEDRAKELFFNGQLLYEEQEYDSAVLAWKKGGVFHSLLLTILTMMLLLLLLRWWWWRKRGVIHPTGNL